MIAITQQRQKEIRLRGKVRYAVVGLGYIAQAAVLPAFVHAKKNSQLVGLFSSDPAKLRELGQQYDVQMTGSYDEYDRLLARGDVDAVYIALPNTMHHEYTIRAAEAGVHVLCEKPMAINQQQCREMIDVCQRNNVKLMISYRLHFEAANLRAAEMARDGTIGNPRLFNSTFAMQVKQGNIRLERELGGGPLFDIGIYCINAARYVFRDEPSEVYAFGDSNEEGRFSEAHEAVSAVMRFANGKQAAFSASFGAANISSYRIIGTRGDLRVEPAYDFQSGLVHHLTVGEKTRRRTYRKRDQFAPVLMHFSECVLQDRQPEPSGEEGLCDVQIIEAMHESMRTGQSVKLRLIPPSSRPTEQHEMHARAVSEPNLVHAESPLKEE